MVAFNIVVFGPSFFDRSSAGAAQEEASGTPANRSGALATDYACQQERYPALVRDSDVKAAFA